MAYGCMFLNRLVVLTVFCFATIEFSACSPTRRQSSLISETTSAEPAVSTSNDAWGDSDDFDLDGEGWLKQPSASSISPGPNNLGDYDDYDDDDNLVMDAEEDDDDNNNDVGGTSEFLFVPPKEERPSRQDDDDDDSHIKVRHTGKYAFSRNMNDDDDDDDDPRPIDDDYEPRLGDEDHSDDHILPIPHRHDDDDDDRDNHISAMKRNDDEDDDEDDDSHIRAVLPKLEVNADEQREDNSVEDDDDNVFETPEEEAADAIYGDRVFLY